MLNPHLEAAIVAMQAYVSNCANLCKQAAREDDGVVSKEEAKVLSKIEFISGLFLRDLDKLLRN